MYYCYINYFIKVPTCRQRRTDRQSHKTSFLPTCQNIFRSVESSSFLVPPKSNPTEDNGYKQGYMVPVTHEPNPCSNPTQPNPQTKQLPNQVPEDIRILGGNIRYLILVLLVGSVHSRTSSRLISGYIYSLITTFESRSRITMIALSWMASGLSNMATTSLTRLFRWIKPE